jgi:hypothetical protein
MSKSPIDLIREYEMRQESFRLAEALLDKVGGCNRHFDSAPFGYLVTYFNHRTDLPEGAALTKMLPKVVRGLEGMGLHEPVSLRGLADKWWLANVDMAFDYPNRESGCGMVEKVASSVDLLTLYRGYYSEVVAGPFDRKEDVK